MEPDDHAYLSAKADHLDHWAQRQRDRGMPSHVCNWHQAEADRYRRKAERAAVREAQAVELMEFLNA